MKYVAKLGGEFLVLRNGASLGRPPCEAVAVLLLALLAELPDWRDRPALARQLYPDSEVGAAIAAFRVALYRLRCWLGRDAVDADLGRVRLAGDWVVHRNLASGELASGYRIAPGVNHPLADEVRRRWSGSEENYTPDIVLRFTSAVSAAASQDRDFGRSLLVAGVTLTESIHPDTVRTLMNVTRPRRREDPYVAEYLEIAAIQLHREGLMQSAIATLDRGFSLAKGIGSRQTAMRLGYRIVFALTESGSFDKASDWFGKVESLRRPNEYRLESANAEASLAWNVNKLDHALGIMARASSWIQRCTRYERLHFLANYSVLATECGDFHLAKDLLARGLEEVSHDSDRIFWLTHGLFTGSQLLASGEGYEAIQHFGNLRSKIEREVDQVGMCYALEWEGEALARAGNRARSEQLFRLLRTKRKEMGCRTNPRTLARIERSHV